MNWLYYLLEANLYLAFFYGFYRLLLHRETFYQLNRYYLLGSSILAFLLPLVQVSYLDSLFHPVEHQATVTIQYPGELVREVYTAPVFTAEDVFFAGYLMVAAYFLFRLGNSLYGILQMAARAEKTRKNGIIQVHFSQSDTAFSFFNLLFINPAAEKQHIILQHEMIHIRQKHSLDILFFELLLICNWFNPLCWLIRRDIKLVHEYIADEASTCEGLVKHDYAMFLIHNSFGSLPNPLTSQMFNQSILKNRISMLNQKRSAGRARLRLLYVFPLTAGMLCASTLGFAKDYAFFDLYAKKVPPVTPIVFQEPKQDKLQGPKTEKKTYTLETVYDAKIRGNRPVKLVVINGKISRAINYTTVSGFDQVKELNNGEAIAKYGQRASKGALEFTGANAGVVIQFPPPLPEKTPRVPKKPAPVEEVKLLPPPPPAKPGAAPLAPPTPDQNGKVKFPPPAPQKPKKPETIKFPPPVVKPMEKLEDHPETKTTSQKEIWDIGPNPLYVNNGMVTAVNPGEGKSVNFTAKSVKVIPKNNPKAISKYGDSAKDGVIELEDGQFFIALPDSKNFVPVKKD